MEDFGRRLQSIRKPLLKYLKKTVRHEMLAEDLLQETMVIALRKSCSLQDDSKLLPWCKSIARNLYLRQLQRTRDEEMFDEAMHVSETEMDLVETHHQYQKTKAILRLFSQLPKTQKDLAHDYYVLGTPRRDICQNYDISTQVFDSRLLRARRQIQAYLGRRHARQADIDFVNRFNELTRGEYTVDEFRIEISPSLIPDLIEGEDNIISFIKTKRMRMLEDFNVRLPKVHVVDTEHLKGDEYIMLVEEKRVREGVLKSGEKLTEMNSIISDVMRGHFQ